MKMTAWFKGTLERMRPQDIDDIFILNEQQGNRTVALTIVVTEAIYIITLLLNILGIFKGRALTVAMTQGIIVQLIPHTPMRTAASSTSSPRWSPHGRLAATITISSWSTTTIFAW